MNKTGYVYILFNKPNGTIYVGVTSNLIKRVYQHKYEFVDSFTKRYHIHKLGYYEIYNNIDDAATREKQLKAGARQRKIDLINKMNPKWDDLYETLFT